MKRFVTIILSVLFLCYASEGYAQYPNDFQFYKVDTVGQSRYQLEPRKRPWIAAAEVLSLDALFHVMTRYVANKDYAKISWSSIKHNFKTGFLWDNDCFETNLFFHPYQGGLYYNAARTNGLNFWESAPYAFAGSFIWEMFLETQPASTNDIISTTLGGIGLGEATYRVSSLILNEQSRGFERVLREVSAAVVNPVRGVSRVIRGKAWKRGPRYVDKESMVPFVVQFGLGYRYLTERAVSNCEHESMGNLDFTMIYNDPFEIDGKQPFQYFSTRLSLNLLSNQPTLGMVKVCASIWGKNHEYSLGREIFWGLFQNFRYYNSEAINKSEGTVPFRISETVSYGPGLMARIPFPAVNGSLVFGGFGSGIVLGGSKSDHFRFQDRDYNMGSGFSLRFEGLLTIWKRLGIYAGFEEYKLYTWKGYEHKDYEHMDPNYLNAQGAVGNACLRVAKTRVTFGLHKDFGLGAEAAWYKRISNYKYFPDVQSDAFELRLMLTYGF